MEQTTSVHEWVEHFVDYDFEGVLICKNSIGAWDEGASLRAFQTFQWASAATQGNDSSFVHIATGVVVRFDGEALAVECGQGQLGDALPDLFDVLYSLNWRETELYHSGPAATANAFLQDLGRAIPARYHDFDIYLAKVDRPVSEFAESAALIARGKQLLSGSGVEDEDSVLLGEMQVLSVRTMGGVVAPSDVPSSQGGGIVLDTDADENDDEVLVVHKISPISGGLPSGYDDDAPRLYELPAEDRRDIGSDSYANDKATIPHLHTELEPQSPSQDQQLIISPDSDDVARLMPIDASVEMIPVQQTLVGSVAPVAPVASVATSAPMLVKTTTSNTSNFDFVASDSVVVVGKSAFCFDMPAAPMTDDDVLAVADELSVGSKDVVHIHPGALGELVRWNVLGDVVPTYPFFIEKLVVEMFGGSDDSPLLASLILALKQRNPCVQLRDLLVFANQGQRDMADALKSVSPEAEMLANRLGSSGDLTQSMLVVMRRLGALALAPAGQAVVDLLPANDEGLERGFTVMQIAQSSAARLYVVHVDQLDGPFVLWIVGLLRFVAANYAATKRYTCVVEDAADVSEVAVEPPTQLEEIAAVAGEMSAILGRLRILGIKFQS
ncbi:hypothetical protein [Janthinobacterium sp. CAN_S7]|uniref:hypothetical protein n=1 Tax=Janthinobacterium sp. CAN_S7 TaxID=3071704 RepID=UPI00319E4073